MLNSKLETFLILCKLQSFSKTADYLHITQPAVSQHIKFLEEYYNGKLFNYSGRRFSLTKRGEMLYNFTASMFADSEHIRKVLSSGSFENPSVSFGATRTIGEYVMPPLIARLLNLYPDAKLKMLVDNTEELFLKMRDGEVDFLVIEGYFKKTDFDVELFSTEKFVGLCAPDSHLAGKDVSLEELCGERLILRENGSGTRDILSHMLAEHNMSIESFAGACEISNMRAIKELVTAGAGITFMYRTAAAEELASGRMSAIRLPGIEMEHEFNFVCTRGSVNRSEYFSWFKFFKEIKAGETAPQRKGSALAWI